MSRRERLDGHAVSCSSVESTTRHRPRSAGTGAEKEAGLGLGGGDGQSEIAGQGQSLEPRDLEERGDFRRGVEVAFRILDRTAFEELADNTASSLDRVDGELPDDPERALSVAA